MLTLCWTPLSCLERMRAKALLWPAGVVLLLVVAWLSLMLPVLARIV